MKKKIFSVLAVVAVAALAFTSCGKDDPAEPVQPNYGYEATFTGKIMLKNNEVTNSLAPAENVWAVAEENLNLLARVKNSNLGLKDTSYTVIPSNRVVYDKTLGQYTIKAPVDGFGRGTSIEIIVNNFKGVVEQNALDISGADSTKSVNVVWKGFKITTPLGYAGSTIYVPETKLTSTSTPGGYTVITNPGDEI